MYKSILVAFDGSPAAAHAFRVALELADQLGTSLVFVAEIPIPAAEVEVSAILDSAKTKYEGDLRRLLANAKSRGIELQTEFLAGHAAVQIIHQAVQSGADLIVMGHRGGSRIKEWLLGSVSKRVLSYAPCPVLIVR